MFLQIAGALLGAASSKMSANASSSAAKQAAKIQQETQNRSLDIQEDQFREQMNMMRPWQQGGLDSQATVNYLLGIGPRPTYSNTAINRAAPQGGYAGGQQGGGYQIKEVRSKPNYPKGGILDVIVGANSVFGKELGDVTKYEVAGKQFGSRAEAEAYANSLPGRGQQVQDGPRTAYAGYAPYQEYFGNLSKQYDTGLQQLQGRYTARIDDLDANRRAADERFSAARQDLTRAGERRDYALSAQGYETSPGYKWARDQGINAVNRSSSAAGLALSGANQKGVMDYASGLAAQDYGNHFNRTMGVYDRDVGVFDRDMSRWGADTSNYFADYGNATNDYRFGVGLLDDKYSRGDTTYRNYLASLTGQAGQGAAVTDKMAGMSGSYAANAGNILQSTGSAIASAYQDAGNAKASGITGMGNAIQNGIQGLMFSNFMNNPNLLTRNSGYGVA